MFQWHLFFQLPLLIFIILPHVTPSAEQNIYRFYTRLLTAYPQKVGEILIISFYEQNGILKIKN